MKEEIRLKELKAGGVVTLSQDARITSLSEYWTVWSRDARTNVSKGWQTSQDQMFRDYVAPILGSEMLSAIDAPKVNQIFHRMRSLGRKESTQLMVYVLLSKMFGDAVEYYEMLDKSPVKAKFHRPKVRIEERSFLTPEQSWVLLNGTRNTYLGLPVWLSLLAGLRISENQALRWDAIDFENDRIIIRSAFNRKEGRIQNHPKQSDWGSAPIIGPLREYLMSERRDGCELVCSGLGKGMMTHTTFSKYLSKRLQELSLPRVTAHELRHSCTEIWINAGASEEDIKRLLNHKSASTTRRYIHRTEGRLTDIGLRVVRGVSFPNSFPTREIKSVSQDEILKA